MWQPILLSAGCIPALILLAAVFIERWRRKRRGERQPLSEKLLRPPGYSLQRKLEDLDDAFIAWFMGTFLFSLGAIGAFAAMPADAIGRFMFFVVFALGAAVAAIMAWRKANQMRDYRRGLLGEQAVAEQLQPLVANGYRIFHDVPGDGQWNIDHVVVGPAGVFAIETKYRTKKPGRAGERDYEVVFDGSTIQYPSGYRDAKALKQARNNARDLAKILGKAVTVRPILALPGWLVTLKAKSDLKVLSGKYVPDFISSEPAQLSDKAIQQISYQLEQRCRDVEF